MLFSVLTFSLLETAFCDFTYPDFNQTLGLVFNGDAIVSSCDNKNKSMTLPSPPHPSGKQAPEAFGMDNGVSQFVESHDGAKEVSEFEVGFGDRSSALKDAANSTSTSCTSTRRLRLTPSAPSKAGSVFYEKRVPVVRP